MDIALLVVGGSHADQEIPIRRASFVIGRDKDCQLRLGCNLVSRRHCAIVVQDGRILVNDLDSTNGTFLNGEEVDGLQEMHHGDHLNVGTFEFQVHALDATAGDRPAGSGHPETISDMSPTAPTNHGVTGREIGLDLLKMDTAVGSTSPPKAKKTGKQPAMRASGNAPESFDSIIVCGEDVTTQLD
jgi:pSer/pThr/pTyr-binding forkhead associated (FHA) protein